MKKIMLCCSAGMSTKASLVKKMLTEAEKRELSVEIKAFGTADFDQQVKNFQVVLLGPQVKYMLPDLKERAKPFGVPVEPIAISDYGMQRGDKVLDFALSLI
ncbi:PTS sugar transporter subunit IIB [Vibrio sp. PP-XX7]